MVARNSKEVKSGKNLRIIQDSKPMIQIPKTYRHMENEMVLGKEINQSGLNSTTNRSYIKRTNSSTFNMHKKVVVKKVNDKENNVRVSNKAVDKKPSVTNIQINNYYNNNGQVDHVMINKADVEME